jgi:putative methionine-R-sulfoxide reductase with GAF domain
MRKLKEIPGTPRRGLLKMRVTSELLSSVPPVVGALTSGVTLGSRPDTAGLSLVSYGIAGWLALAGSIKVWQAGALDRAAAEQSGHEGLTAALTVLHAATGHVCGIPPEELDERLRATVHRVVPPVDRPEFIEQLIPYVGGNGGGENRRFSVRSGITGKCVREKIAFIAALEGDEAARRRELREDWGYTDHDLKSLSMDRLSSMAVPILSADRQHAVGVVYLDSDQPDLFSAEDVQSSIIKTCGAVIAYVNERYSR